MNDQWQQNYTFLPHFLVFTALYRKRNWEGFFHTTPTLPAVAVKQGQVINPEQERILSVRRRNHFLDPVLAKV